MKELKDARLSRNMTQLQLAEKIGRQPALISHWETGVKEPNVESIRLLAKGLGMTFMITPDGDIEWWESIRRAKTDTKT